MTDASNQNTVSSDASSNAGTQRPRGQSVTPSDIASVIQTIRGMIANGRKEDAQRLLKRVIERVPQYTEPWLQLLALEPEPAEELVLLTTFLQHHPQHRYAQAFAARLHDLEIITLLDSTPTRREQPQPQSRPEPPIRLGDFLIAQGWVTLDQVQHAVQEQKRLRQVGIEQRLGTLLLRDGYLDQDQLALALMKGRTVGLGEFGSYLVRQGILTPEEVGRALARQAAIAVEQERQYLKATERRTSKPIPRQPIPRLGEIMVDMGMLTQEQVAKVLYDREEEFNTSFD